MKRLIILSVLFSFIFAQYNQGNTVVTWSKYKWNPMSEVEGATWTDRVNDVTEFHSKRNPVARNLLSSMMLTHYWTGSVQDVHLLGEFRNMGDATDYAGVNNLNQMAWRNQDERTSAVRNYNRHFQSYHEDVHIFENWTALEKKRKIALTGEETFVSGPVVVVSVRYFKNLGLIENGSADERLGLLKKFANEVVKKNPQILSQKVLTHLWSDSIEGGRVPVYYITEYASMEDADNVNNGPYVEAAFSEEERSRYNGYFHPLTEHHDDLGLWRNFEPANKN
jgi:hypothetical protein